MEPPRTSQPPAAPQGARKFKRMGFGLSDDRLHSPNEKFNITHYFNGIRTIARLLDRMAG